ncbi:MAG: arginine--tRNA ligase [Candidatus Moraniibacteriota bacterium]|jgi:arginyl-tRNA synthetase
MKKIIEELIEKSIKKLQKDNIWSGFDIPEIIVERPKDFTHGDWMTNVAFQLSKELKKAPIEIANELADIMEVLSGDKIDNCAVAAPGFINISVTYKHLQDVVENIIKEGNSYGSNNSKKNFKINNEFISANPTGPIHLGNGRGGFLGDAMGNVLKKNGADVTSEYYINDAGEQVITLGHSVLKDEHAVYAGDYIDKLNGQIEESDISDKKDAMEVGQWAADIIVETYLKTMTSDLMHIDFDSWISEKRDIVETDYVEKAIDKLKQKELVFESEGAIWLKTTKFGDDKDRVLIKGDGVKTYFASDCGYILNKMDRGFNHIIEVWGADHHGYIVRFEAAARALGFEGEIKFIIVQLVRLMKDGKEVRMSKRAGNVIYIDELIEEVGHDVARFFFLMQSSDSHMDFDLELAKEKSSKNPVYYVQYAHARLAGILEKGLNSSFTNEDIEKCSINELTHKKEKELMRELEVFSEMIEDIANTYHIHQLPHYAIRLAEKFHSFYTECKVIDEDNKSLSLARLKLVKATKIVIAETLNTIGVSAPDNM